MRYVFFCFFLSFFLLGSCIHQKNPENYLLAAEQSDYNIIAVPAFYVPNPTKNVYIDYLTLFSQRIQSVIEKSVIDSFIGQEKINGISFNQVREALEKQKKSPHVYEQMANRIQLFATGINRGMKSLSLTCFNSENFFEFYLYCLQEDASWRILDIEFFSLFPRKHNQLLIFVTDLADSHLNQGYSFTLEAQFILVHGETSEVLWSNVLKIKKSFGNELLNNDFYERLFKKEMNEANFWEGFPGRK